MGFSWPTGPDLFPNRTLGYPLALFQIVAAIFLVVSGIRLAHNRTGVRGILFGIALVVVTAAVCLVTYSLGALWYHINFMGRSV